MINLFRFLWKHINFIFFLLFEIFCVYLIVSNNSFQKARFVSSSNYVAGNIYSTITSIREYFYLKETNEALALENARLHNITRDVFARNSTQVYLVKDSVFKQQYQYINAKITNNSVNKRNNYLTLNRGSSSGIGPEMAVISSNGIVGITKDVSENFTSVLSVLNKNAKISAKIKKNNYFGSLSWDGRDYRLGIFIDIPTHVNITVGDTIVTNAFSDIFPENILIGKIESFDIKPGDNFFTIIVRFSTNFKNVTHVYVVTNIMKEERKKLELHSQQNDK